jgi:hypothetical protein
MKANIFALAYSRSEGQSSGMGTYVMSREFVAAARSFCEVEPTTLFAGTHQEPSWRGSSPRTIARSPPLAGIKVVDLASGKPSRGRRR